MFSQRPTWCPGCGNWSIHMAIKKALAESGLALEEAFIVFGIGCSGNMNDFLDNYSMHGLHGRSIANAVGLKMANHKKKVIVMAGDGDTYGEGGNHLLHACRGNHDLKLFVHDNHLYGLTTGQVSPTSKKGMISKSTPQGMIDNSFDPLSLALTQGATFVAQAFAGDVPALIVIMKEAIAHKGFAIVNILQPCVTFDKVMTYKFYLERIFSLPAEHDRENLAMALSLVMKAREEEKFPIGVLYQKEKATYTGEHANLKTETLLDKKRYTDFKTLMAEFR